jgi:hypothetical protein
VRSANHLSCAREERIVDSANAVLGEAAGWPSARFGADRASAGVAAVGARAGGVSGVGCVRAITEMSELDELLQTPEPIDGAP